MTEADFLAAVRQYVEDTQQTLDAEYHLGRSLEELIAEKAMPRFYEELLRRIAALGGGC